MQKTAGLNELFLRYRQGSTPRKHFEGELLEHVIEHHYQYHPHYWEKDDYVDYLSWLYPRLSRAIDAYREKGSSFDSYITAVIRWSIKEYSSRQADHLVTEKAAWKIRSTEMEAASGEYEYLEPAATPGRIKNPRQVLILALKSYYFVSEDFAARIAPQIGISGKELQAMIENLRRQRLVRDEAVRDFQERVHCQFYRCVAYERRFQAAPENSAYQETMRLRLKRARTRLAAMRKRLAGIRLDATNRQVALALGVPKGTIDSSLSALWKRARAGDARAFQADKGLSLRNRQEVPVSHV